MSGFQSFDPAAQVMGGPLLGFITFAGRVNILPILHKHNLEHIDPEQWYSMQTWLDALSDVYRQDSSMFDLVAIGIQVIEHVYFPPEVDSIEKALLGAGYVYQMHHRGNSGYIRAEMIGERRIRHTACTPYPDDFMYGTTYGVAKRFKPAGAQLRVYRSNAVEYRRQDDAPATFEITW